MKLIQRPLLVLSLWFAAFVAGYLGYSYSQTGRVASAQQQFAQSEQERAEVRKGLMQAEDLATVFRNVGRVLEPSVVNINVRKKTVTAPAPRLDPEMLKRLFPDRDGDGEPDVPEGFVPEGLDPLNPHERDFNQQGTGSGVIMEVDGKFGFILTNNHVAGGAEEMIVTLHDGREIRNGQLLGADPKSDLAVIRIEADRLSPAEWGNSDELQKGDWILAFGSPFNFVGSMTHGIVSALDRQAGILGSGGYENFIQVDAPINPGNSGGPLVNLRGEVVGINTAIASRSGGFQGIGFTIPSNQARFVYTALKQKGKVTRGWLGVGISDVARNVELAESFGWDKLGGVLVDQVIPDTPATGKLKPGDIITELNGSPVASVQQLRNTIATLAPASPIKVVVFRDKKLQTIDLTLGTQPDELAAVRGGREPRGPGRAPAVTDALGLKVQTLTEDLARRHRLILSDGAFITNVDPNSAAARAGLRPGMAITEVGDQEVSTAEEFAAATKDVDLKKGVRLYVTSPEGSRYVFLSASR